eukprot:TRINITY_DN9100_c0_g1_i1.p3 TRINITY_DN9100_c0_g1~~TRINITY_DN9100_c0_g1_i1.p3  ORF type:complete len:139 (-),score=36.75 TRINITY_DN9100_c0_g1_i1:94-471(-)
MPAPSFGVPQDFQPMVAFDKAGLKIMMNPRKEVDGSMTVVARFGNCCEAPMTNFQFEAAVPKYVKLSIQPATGQVLPPRSDVVSQTLNMVNTSNGEKPLLMKLRICYSLNGQQVQEMGQVNGFPA